MQDEPAQTGSRMAALALSAAGLVGALLYTRSVGLAYDLARPVPYWDQWDFVRSVPSILSGSYALKDLVAQHNEHRIATARVFFILDIMYADGSSYLCTAVLYASLALIAGVMAFVADARRRARWTLFLIFAGLLSSPAQWENLSSGFQIQFPFVDLFFVASLVCLVRAVDVRPPRATAIVLAASTLDLLAVFSMASGVLTIVPALFAGLLVRPKSPVLYAYAAFHVVWCALFFHGYYRLSDMVPTYDPLLLTQYVVAYLGGCLRGVAHAPVLLGSADLLLLLQAAVITVRRSMRSRATLDHAQVVAVAVALMMVLNAAVTAYGRARLGVATATGSRYAIQSILLQLALMTFYWRDSAPHGGRRVAALAGLTALALASSLSPLSLLEWRERASTLENAGAALVNGVWSDAMLSLIYPIPGSIAEPVRFLAAHRLGPFSPRFGRILEPPENALLGREDAAVGDCTANFGATWAGPHWLTLEGWVFDPDRPAGNGFVIVIDGDDTRRVLGFGRQSILRDDVDRALGVAVGSSGFNVGLDMSAVTTPGPSTLTVILVPEDAAGPICRASISWPE